MAGVMTIDAWMAARAARDVGVASAELVVEQFTAGYCYLRLIVPALRQAVIKVVGAWPTLVTLMGLPVGLFRPQEQLVQERCALVGENELHVGRGGISLSCVVAHAAIGLDGLSGSFGSIWVPRYSGLMLSVDEIRSLLVGGGGVPSDVCPAVEVVLSPVQGRADRPGVVPGYCYAAMVYSDCTVMAMQYLGPDPDLGSLLRAPYRLFEPEKLSTRVELLEHRRLHVTSGGSFSFYDLAYTAVVGSVGHFPVGSLGEHILMNPVEQLELEVRLGWTIGALSSAAAALAAELVRLSGLALTDLDGRDLEIACKTAALLDSNSKARLRILEAVGDNALSMLVVQRCAVNNLNVQEYQDARGALTNNNYLGELFVNVGLDNFVQFVAGVAHNGKVGGSCFEVIIGILYNAGSMHTVEKVCNEIGYYRGYSKWADG